MNRSLVVVLAAAGIAASSNAEVGLIVRLAPGGSPTAIATKYGIPLVDTTPGAPFAYYLVPDGKAGDKIQLRVSHDKTVVWADDDARLSAPEGQKGSTLPAVGDRFALYQQNTGMLAQINWNQTLAFTAGRTVRIAVLDTGLSPNQPDLWSKVDASTNEIEPGSPAYDIPQGHDSNSDGLVDNMTGHGTMVAGILDQISPLSRLVVARVADSDGIATGWNVIKGLAFAVVSEAEVANISLGTLDRVPALTDVMDWCEDEGLLVVASIGNNGIKAATFPARISKVVCVAGLLPDDSKAPFSNWEGTADACAPATGIVSQSWEGTMGVWSGTSFAAPMAAAIAADALRHSTGRMDPDVLRDAFKSLGTNVDSLNSRYRQQLGLKLNHQEFVEGVLAG
ncbi:MAG TPA: S8 family serine peptidase [Chthoniobacteraceae bacterium]|nr:S8 family serine peptidase [Chthoniobacteraceae bacterium]